MVLGLNYLILNVRGEQLPCITIFLTKLGTIRAFTGHCVTFQQSGSEESFYLFSRILRAPLLINL